VPGRDLRLRPLHRLMRFIQQPGRRCCRRIGTALGKLPAFGGALGATCGHGHSITHCETGLRGRLASRMMVVAALSQWCRCLASSQRLKSFFTGQGCIDDNLGSICFHKRQLPQLGRALVGRRADNALLRDPRRHRHPQDEFRAPDLRVPRSGLQRTVEKRQNMTGALQHDVRSVNLR